VKYLLLICQERPADEGPDEESVDWTEQTADVEPWLRETGDRGVRVFSSRLAPPAEAATVRVRDGKLLVTDGPFAETKEWIAGFDVIDCGSLDEAIEIASKHPAADGGLIEVRAFRPEPWRALRPYPGSLM
jgi:hypothetical protein